MNSSNQTLAPDDDAIHDPERLQEIARLDLFSEEVQTILDDMAEEAAQKLDLPIGMVSLVLDEAQYLAGRHGVPEWMDEADGSPVEWSYCQYTVKDDDEFVVEDSTENERTKDSPFTEEEGLRCYAGIPLETSRGHVIGSFCAAGTEARSFTDEELAEMRTLADRTIEVIEDRAAAA